MLPYKEGVKTKYPIKLEDGGEFVKVRKINDHGRESFRLEYYVAGKRKIKDRVNEADAIHDAKRILAMLNERAPVFSQTEDATLFRAAKTVLNGVAPVDEAARQFAVATQKLGGKSLIAAVEFFLKNQPENYDTKIPVLVERFAAGIKAEVSFTYFRSIRSRLRRFARRFPGFLHEVTALQIDTWIKGLNLAKRSRNNERAAVITFSLWARDHGHLPLGMPVAAAQLKKLDAPTTVTIFPVAVVVKLLAAIQKERPALLAYVTLGFFAGVRPGELTRLDFASAIRWNHDDIEIRADQAKTGFRRLTKLQPNLKAWLADFKNAKGLIAPSHADKKLAAFAKAKGFGWPKDVMRHSFISYAVAMTQQIGQVALWAGNSEAIIKRHYLERVTEAEGNAFFSILPGEPANVIAIDLKARAA